MAINHAPIRSRRSRRSPGATLPPDQRERLAAALAVARPEALAARADVSASTLRRAAAGESLSPLARRAILAVVTEAA